MYVLSFRLTFDNLTKGEFLKFPLTIFFLTVNFHNTVVWFQFNFSIEFFWILVGTHKVVLILISIFNKKAFYFLFPNVSVFSYQVNTSIIIFLLNILIKLFLYLPEVFFSIKPILPFLLIVL